MTKTEYRVAYADTDAMGVMYYANYLVLFERARNELMRECGYSYRECEAAGVGLPVVHAECDYGRSARYDDVLEVSAWVKEARGVRLDVACEVRRKGGGEVLASGFTRHVFVDLATFRPRRPPPEMAAALASAKAGADASARGEGA